MIRFSSPYRYCHPNSTEPLCQFAYYYFRSDHFGAFVDNDACVVRPAGTSLVRSSLGRRRYTPNILRTALLLRGPSRNR